ncbi:MAG: hypothetical protein AB8H47_13745 [Bacteroidia bacterium]
MKHLFFVLCLIVSVCIFSAFITPSENARGVRVADTDGGYLIVGTKTTQVKGPCDVWLIKTNALGEEIWSRTYGGNSYDKGTDVQPTRDGGYLIVGHTSSYGAGNYDVFLIKTDAKGKQLWNKVYGDFFNEYGYSIEETSRANFLIRGKKQFCSGNNVGNCFDLPWQLLVDAEGNILESRTETEREY